MSGKPEYFLDIERSATGMKWLERLDARNRQLALAIAQQHDVPELVGRVMAARGVEPDTAGVYLNPTLRDLMPDPSTMTDMDALAARIAKAIIERERIAIFGDYDVDGAASSALMSLYFQHFNVPHEIYIPDRIFEGYGPNPEAISQLVENGAKLIITVDCGATSFEALDRAKELGVDVVVADHHQMGTQMPHALALVNPNRQDDLSGLGHLCAGGVVFMALVAINRHMRGAGYEAKDLPNLMNWLDLVALATVCDVVPLTGLNRAFVVRGIEIMHEQNNPGIKALAQVSRLDGPIKPYHLGFMLGPRINAGGRIGDAALGARLLSGSDPQEAEKIAIQLDELNAARQHAEKQMLEAAIAEADVEMSAEEGPAVVVTESADWHPGIVGILASRLKDRYKRPAFAIAFDGAGKGAGSGRSISGVDLGGAVRKALEEGILEKGGGHAMAAGLTVMRDKLGQLRSFFEAELGDKVQEQRALQSLKIDGALTARSATLELIDYLDHAGPYGSGNPQPVFVFPAHQVRYAKVVGADHVSVTLASGDGANLRAISFRSAETELGQLLLNGGGDNIHVAGTLSADYWQGSRRVQLRIIDAVKPQYRI